MPGPGFYVRLSEKAIAQLVDLALQERRHPGEQAAILIEEALGLRCRSANIIWATKPEATKAESGKNAGQ